MKLNARQIVRLLESRHLRDLFIPECKDGPTRFGGHLRIDAWAMNRSWANATMYGYEVKVSRSDWLKDQKLHAYLPLCNVLYIVAPSGVVKDEEIPEGVGLLVVNSKGTGLLTKRKAKHREVDDPTVLFRYVLMSRVEVSFSRRIPQTERFRDFIEGRRDRREIGALVSRRLREETVEEVRKSEERADHAERKLKAMESAAKTLRDLGFENGIPGDWEIRKRILRATDRRRGMLMSIRSQMETLAQMAKELEEEDQSAAATNCTSVQGTIDDGESGAVTS